MRYVSFLAFIDPSCLAWNGKNGFNLEEYTNRAHGQTAQGMRVASALAANGCQIFLSIQRLIGIEFLGFEIGASLFGSRQRDFLLGLRCPKTDTVKGRFTLLVRSISCLPRALEIDDLAHQPLSLAWARV
jgi:hypothetical protein